MSRRTAWFGLLAGLIAIASIAACRQLVGVGDDPAQDLVTSACGLPYGTNGCASCVDTSCCAESTTCAADPVCAAYAACLGRCDGDPACRSQCTIDNPTGTASDVSALSACLASRCETACNLPCGALADLLSPPDAAAGCQECLSRSCAQARTCASSADCDGFERCATSCMGPSDCGIACQTAHQSGAGVPPISDGGPDPGTFAGAPWITNCATQCATGGYWACVGHVSWPRPKVTTTTITFHTWDYPMQTSPLGGLDVKVCRASDTYCDSPITDGTTNDAGTVPLTFPTIDNVTGFGLNGYLQIDSSTMSVVPYLYYWGFPLSERQWPAYYYLEAPDYFTMTNALIDVTPDPSRGYVFAVAYDCLSNAAPGVMITAGAPDAGVQAFDINGTPNAPTDVTGVIGLYNVPAGLTEVTATPLVLGRASSKVSVSVRPGTISAVLLFPTPTP
jgi:hypothetical protein